MVGKRAVLTLVLAVGLCVARAPLVHAQTTTGSIQGAVVDSSGAALPGVTVIIRNTGTNAERTTITNASGNYDATLLPPGTYNVSAELTGFRKIEKTGITLQVNQRARIDFSLDVSAIQESVQVVGEAPLVDTADTAAREVVDYKKIVGLPLNGRNFVDLGLTTPGVQAISSNSNVASRGGGLNIAGASEVNNNYLLDGFDNNDPTTGEIQTFPSVDAIQEFTILGAAYGADVGFAAGGVVSLVTRSGSSEFHGGAFEFLRDSKMDAKNFFATSNPPLSRHQFGATLGGPAPMKHTFFFGSYERTRHREGLTTSSTVPTAAMKAGDFSGLGRAVRDPLTGQPFPGNVIPAGRMSAIGAKILRQLYPDPNNGNATRNYIISPDTSDDLHQATGRFDYQPSGNNSFFGRYQMYWDTKNDASGASFPIAFTSIIKHNQNIGIGWTHVFSSQTVQEVRGSYGHVDNEKWPTNREDWGAALGLTGTLSSRSKGFLDMGPPIVSLTGYSSVNPFSNPFIRLHNLYQGSYALTQNKGNHGLKYGATYRRFTMDISDSNTPQGNLAFTGQFTGNAVADLLLGYPAQTQNLIGPEVSTERSWEMAAFVQDEWRATQRVTLNYGLRYEYQAPDTEVNREWGTFIPALGKPVQVGTNGVPVGIRNNYYKNFAPRAGVAWDISGSGQRVVRAHYGTYYESLAHNIFSPNAFLTPPISFRGVFTALPTTPNITLDNAFPSALAGGVSSASGVARDYHGGRTHRWMLDFQQAIGGSGMVDVAYVGSVAHGVAASYNLNQPTPGPGAVGPRRPFPAYSSITWTDANGWMKYNALQSKFQQRVSRGVGVVVAYTLAKNTGNTNVPGGNQDPLNRDADEGPVSWDRTHRLVISGTYDSPFQAIVLRNWQLGLIWTLASGAPLTPTLSIDRANVGSLNNQRPNVSGEPNLSGGDRGPDRWFNTAAFSIPAQFSYGNAGVGIVRGPGENTVNMALSRSFGVGGSRALALRLEAFNLLNHVNFGNPNMSANSALFGQIFSAGPARQIQLGAKFTF